MGKYISKSEKYLNSKNADARPLLTSGAMKGVSDYRQNELIRQAKQGQFHNYSEDDSESGYPAPIFVSGMKKTAETFSSGGTSGSGGGSWRGSGGTQRMMPEIYSPLWLTSNLNLPRDKATINAWCRAFFTLNPYVRNAILLHSTYPISKLNIKCKDAKIGKFFETMIEEIDLLNICSQMAQEYFTIGETFPFAELDEGAGKWRRILIQNPDYITVQGGVSSGDTIISLRPDENLRRIVTSNRPSDVQQRQKLNPAVIQHVLRGENIPLDNFYISHLANKIAPYEIRGTGLPVTCFKALMLWDQLKECFDQETEVLTDTGFQKIGDFIYHSSDVENSVGVGILKDNTVNYAKVKEIKIACVNLETNSIEYHPPINATVSQYSGEMLHYSGTKVDVCVTPNHKMLIKRLSRKNAEWEKISAEDSCEIKSGYKFKTLANWKGEDLLPNLKSDFGIVNVCGYEIPAEIYLKLLGHLISEGCVYQNYKNGRYDNIVSISQSTKSPYYQNMRQNFEKFAELIDKKCHTIIKLAGRNDGSFSQDTEMWEGKIINKEITNYFRDEIGFDGKSGSHNKKIPRWVLNLDQKYLKILLDAMIEGDAHIALSKYNNTSISFQYTTVCKKLADDTEELVYKLGYTPNIYTYQREREEHIDIYHVVLWSNTHYGTEPIVYPQPFPSQIGAKNGGGAHIEKINYNGLVWCFEVPTGVFITRRNGLITIQGNCKYVQAADMINPISIWKIGGAEFKPTPVDLEAWREIVEQSTYDRNFKIVTHEQVSLERVGAGAGIYDATNDMTALIKEFYVGLLVPSVIIDGGGDTTYQNGGVALDVLRQRYMMFRNMMTTWLRRKIFAPISRINEFYENIDGEKVLIVPEVDWNHMSLFDTTDYIAKLSELAGREDPKVSLHSLYRGLGLNMEEETRRIKEEQIQFAILRKEKVALDSMSLTDLRALNPNEEIKEVVDESGVPGMSSVPGVSGLGSETPGTDLGGLPGLGTAPETTLPPSVPAPPPEAPKT